MVSRGNRGDPGAEELAEAVERARGGDEQAIAALYRWLNPRLLRFLRYRCRQEADDVASEVWLDVARRLPRFVGGPAELQAFVFTVARCRVVDRHRSRSRDLPTVQLDGTEGDPVEESAEDVAIERVSGERAVELLVAGLPPDQAEIVLLRVLGDLSVAQVATLVGKTEAAVRVAQHRALRKLAQRLNRSGVTR